MGLHVELWARSGSGGEVEMEVRTGNGYMPYSFDLDPPLLLLLSMSRLRSLINMAASYYWHTHAGAAQKRMAPWRGYIARMGLGLGRNARLGPRPSWWKDNT
jgi:hypothetical protein